MAGKPPEGWREPKGAQRRATSLAECARILGTNRDTLKSWAAKGWLEEAKAPGGKVLPYQAWKVWRRKWEAWDRGQRGGARGGASVGLSREQVEAALAREEDEARREQLRQELEVVSKREYWEARKIKEDGEKALYAAQKAKREYEMLLGRLVTTDSVRDAFRELAGAAVNEILMLVHGHWISPEAQREAEAEAAAAGRRLEAMAHELKLRRPEEDE